MLWRIKGLKKKENKDMNDKVMIWESEKYVAWLQKTQINSIFYLWENKTNKHKQKRRKIKEEQQRQMPIWKQKEKENKLVACFYKSGRKQWIILRGIWRGWRQWRRRRWEKGKLAFFFEVEKGERINTKRPGLPSLITLLRRWWTSTASWEPSCRGTASSQGYRERRLRKPLERPPQGCLEVGCQTREVYSSSLSLMKKEKKFWRGG